MQNPYDIFWDTSWKPYVHLMDDYREALSMAMLRRGVTDINTDKASTRSKVVNQARDDLIEGVKTMEWKFDISDYTDLPEAQSYIHQGWSGDFVSVQYYYPSWSPRDVIKYWYPSNHKGAVGGDHISILAGGKNPVLAHKFLDFMLDFDNSMINFTWVGYQPPQKRITDPNSLLKNSPNPLTPYNVIPPQLATAVVSQDDFDQGYQELELAPDVDAMWKSAWEAVQTA
jgi:spermidine/putrescine transport system substrate-binding protein